jgi:UDP-N-acetyl-2-amino-2-deoxyglucuronate dehydrogenase
MPDQINIGIIGCGAIAARHGEALASIPEVRLITACDTAGDRAENFTSKYGGTTSDDYRRLLDDPGIEAVIITTPSGLHPDMGLAALDAGKHVLVEKPLALNSADAERLVERACSANCCLSTVHPNRAYPTSKMIYEAIRGNRLGKLSHGVATLRWNRSQAYYEEAPWRKLHAMDGGILFNQAWHALDLLLWFLGPVAGTQRLGATRLHDIETDDIALVTIQFAGGSLGLVEATTNIYPKNLEQTISIFGEQGTIVLGGNRIDALKLWRVAGDDEQEVLSKWGGDAAPRHTGSWAHEQVLREFLEQIASGTVISPSVEGALEDIRVCSAE